MKRVHLVAATVLLSILIGAKLACADPANVNLIVDPQLQSSNGRVPPGWHVHTVPDCGFRYKVHPDPDGNQFEIINDAPIESVLEQTVHLTPGWYSFTADIKIESMGSEGAAPELFVKAASFSVENRVHPVIWSDDWQQYRAVFRAGEKVQDFVIGCGLGQWGNPNRGRFLFRNPMLAPTEDPEALQKKSGLQVTEGYDMEGKVEERFFHAMSEAAADQAPKPARKTPGISILNARWSFIALNLMLLVFATLGWRAVSPSSRN